MKHTWSGREEKTMMKLVVAHESDRVQGGVLPVLLDELVGGAVNVQVVNP